MGLVHIRPIRKKRGMNLRKWKSIHCYFSPHHGFSFTEIFCLGATNYCKVPRPFRSINFNPLFLTDKTNLLIVKQSQYHECEMHFVQAPKETRTLVVDYNPNPITN